MREIGDHLARHAKSLKTGDPLVDAFTRSALNRYYYAVFLRVREMYLEFYPNAERAPPHGDFPDIVKGVIYRKVRDAIQRAEQNGLLDRGPAERAKHRVRELTRELRDLLNLGYGMRIVADYEPDRKVVARSGDLFLEDTSLSAAARWCDKAEFCAGGILAKWRELGT